MLALLLLFFGWPVALSENIQEVDSLVLMKHHVNLHRIKEHILAWGEDQGVGVFRSELMTPLMSHLTVEVAMLASTLMEHQYLENAGGPTPSTPTALRIFSIRIRGNNRLQNCASLQIIDKKIQKFKHDYC